MAARGEALRDAKPTTVLFTESNAYPIAPQEDGLELKPIELIPNTCRDLVLPGSTLVASLVGQLAADAWVRGLGLPPVPPEGRNTILVITDYVRDFREQYLTLSLSREDLGWVLDSRRTNFQRATPGILTRRIDRANSFIEDRNFRLHDFLPAVTLSPDGTSKPVAGRDRLGRLDDDGGRALPPAVLLAPSSYATTGWKALLRRYRPFLVVVDCFRVERVLSGLQDRTRPPVILARNSIFGVDLATGPLPPTIVLRKSKVRTDVPSTANLGVRLPIEPPGLSEALARLSGSISSLRRTTEQLGSESLLPIARTLFGIQSLVVGLPVPLETYEIALQTSSEPDSIKYNYSIRRRLSDLSGQRPVAAAVSASAEIQLSRALEAFDQVVAILNSQSAKAIEIRELAVRAKQESRPLLILHDDPVVCRVLDRALHAPMPIGLGLDSESTPVVPLTYPRRGYVSSQHPDISHQHLLVGSARPSALERAVTSACQDVAPTIWLMWRNELEVLGAAISPYSATFPDSHDAEFFAPLVGSYRSLPSRLPPAASSSGIEEGSNRLVSALFDRTFIAASTREDLGTVLVDESDLEAAAGPLPAVNVFLRQGAWVTLRRTSNLPCIRSDGIPEYVLAEELQPGDQLIRVRQEARMSVASRLLQSRKGVESQSEVGELLDHWRKELEAGLERTGLTYGQLLGEIRKRSSTIESPTTIGSWVRGGVRGPADVKDLQRVAEVIQSSWLTQRWQEVAYALLAIRRDHRSLGQRLRHIIVSIASGRVQLSPEDQDLLLRVGVTLEDLRGAVALYEVDRVEDGGLTTPDQLGRIYYSKTGNQG